MLATILLPECAFDPTPDVSEDDVIDAPEVEGPSRFWALVHRTDPPATGAGIYLVDLAAGVVTGPIPVPDVITSPHGLFDDGAGLLVAGFTDEPYETSRSVYRLDYDGTVIEALSGADVEGVTESDGLYYVAGSGEVQVRAADWSYTGVISAESVTQDVAVIDRTVFVLSNDSGDTIRAYDLDHLGAGPTVLTDEATFDNTGYAMTAWGGRLLVVDEDADGKFLHHLDATSGETFGITRFEQEGWITAIALVEGT